MKKYVLKRLLSLIPTIFIVSVVIFLLVHLTPGDPAAAMLGEDATAAEIAALQTQLGLDDPLVVQYFRWVGNCLQALFGVICGPFLVWKWKLDDLARRMIDGDY